MCGRFSQTRTSVELEAFQSEFKEHILEPRYNLAPTQTAPAILLEEGELSLRDARFGLIPFWAKDEKFGYKTINGRAETIDTKPAFRSAFRKRRCLVLADGYYEWKKGEGSKELKTPFRFILPKQGQFAFGALWETWKRPEDGEEILSFALITTTPNSKAAEIHDRMPFILRPEQYAGWLDPERQDPKDLKREITPFPEKDMDFYEVSRIVNNARNENPRCIDPMY